MIALLSLQMITALLSLYHSEWSTVVKKNSKFVLTFLIFITFALDYEQLKKFFFF